MEEKTKAVGKPAAFRKLAICGTADSMETAPFDDRTFEIWGVAPCLTYPKFKRWDVIFEMHDKSYAGNQQIIERLNRADTPVYMQKHNDEVPKSIEYPLADVNTMGYRKNFTSSIVYMLAMAILKKYNHIGLFGVHMSGDDEYAYQRPACEYWIGIAEAIGIDIHLTKQSSICSCKYIYGYEAVNPIITEMKARKTGLDNGAIQENNDIKKHQQQYWKNIGASMEVEHWLKQYGAWKGT